MFLLLLRIHSHRTENHQRQELEIFLIPGWHINFCARCETNKMKTRNFPMVP